MAEPFDPWLAMRDAASRLHDDPDTLRNLTVFIDFWGMDCYTPPAAVEKNVRDLVQVFAYAAKTGAPYAAGYVPASEVQRAREEALAFVADMIEQDADGYEDDAHLAQAENRLGEEERHLARTEVLRDAVEKVRALATPPETGER